MVLNNMGEKEVGMISTALKKNDLPARSSALRRRLGLRGGCSLLHIMVNISLKKLIRKASTVCLKS